MAEIYDKNANYLAEGLQGSKVCDEAIQAARWLAAERDEDVFLEDDDKRLTVHPDGTTEEDWEGAWD